MPHLAGSRMASHGWRCQLPHRARDANGAGPRSPVSSDERPVPFSRITGRRACRAPLPR